MRVAFVDQAGGKPGGAQESLALLLDNLPPDIAPIVVLFEDGEFAQRLRDKGFTTRIVAMSEGLRSVTREKPSSLAVVSIPSTVYELVQLFRAERIDLVHTNTVKAHLFAAPAARLAGIPSVMHLRDMVGGIGRSALRAVARTCSRQRIAISGALSRWYDMPKTITIANPVDLTRYVDMLDRSAARRELGIPLDGKPLIGIVGRINRWKGHDRFLRIAAAVNARTPIRCVIVGEARFRDTDFVPELHALAAELGIGASTTFVPWLNDPRVAYAALDVHCNCSEREPFGRSIVEAAAAGVPTVAFDDGGAPDIIRDRIDGRIVPAGDNDAFSAAVLTLVSDGVLRAKYGAAARDGSARFAAPAHAALVADVLRESAA